VSISILNIDPDQYSYPCQQDQYSKLVYSLLHQSVPTNAHILGWVYYINYSTFFIIKTWNIM